MSGHPTLYVATSIAEASAALAERGPAGAALAGATWIMRAPIRQDRRERAYVAIGRIAELKHSVVLEREVQIGACATHAEIVALLAGVPECRSLTDAAGNAANPAIREVATIGGNLCAAEFAAADLVPALLCLDAEVEVEGVKGGGRLPVDRFLAGRAAMAPGTLLRRIVVPRGSHRSAHARLPLRKAGDYPVAIVSVAVRPGPGGVLDDVRIAVGSVEPVARRWRELEAELIGRPLDPEDAAARAEARSGDFRGRDGIEAPGWYRETVLPTLVRRAMRAIQEQP